MSEADWLRSEDVGLMLRWFRQGWPGEEADLDLLVQRYLFACCRRIWPLLVHPKSREGVEVAERFAEGRATSEESAEADWLAEGAGFGFEHRPDFGQMQAFAQAVESAMPGGPPAFPSFDVSPETVDQEVATWCEEVARMSPDVLAGMLQSPCPESLRPPLNLLRHAAYFANAAMCYVGLRPEESIERYRIFLPAALLREVVGNPFRDRGPASGAIIHT